MKAVSAALAAALSFAALASPAAADRWHYLIDQRLAEHARLIDDGRQDGSLSRSEVRQLRSQQRFIATLAARYQQDGLSRDERADLRSLQDEAAADIFRLRNNDVRASRYLWWSRY